MRWSDVVATGLLASVVGGVGCRGARSHGVVGPGPRHARAGPDDEARGARRRPAAAAPSGAPRVRYAIRVAPGAAALDVTVCSDGFSPPRLVPTLDGTARLVTRVRGTRGTRLAVTRDEAGVEGVDLAALRPGECVRYEVDGAAAMATPHGLVSPVVQGRGRLLSPDLWLWEPFPRDPAIPVTARIVTAPGETAALSWPQLPDGTYRVPRSQFEVVSQACFGKLHRSEVAAGSTRIRVQSVGAPLPAGADGWLSRAASAVASLHGGAFPGRPPTVFVVPSPERSGFFGYAVRGGGPTVVLLSPTAPSPADYGADWTAVHELFHLTVPVLDRADAWLTEGLATYYQEVLRARVGWTSPTIAWSRLVDGFERGRRSGTGRTLGSESATMHQTGAYYRVYWAGVAFAVEADLLLRRRGHSLDDVLRGVAECCLGRTDLTGPELLKAMDRSVATTPLLATLGARYVRRRAFPPVAGLLRRLGVQRRGAGRVVLTDGPWAAHRRAIMQPR